MVATRYDGTRPTIANRIALTEYDLLSNATDLQGFSHKNRETLDDCHARRRLPRKAIVAAECCSCNTMRDQDEGCETLADNPHYTCNQKSFNARCLERLVNASDGTAYASGTFVWTLFDYYGEPPSRPLTVSSTYGQFDLCGFPKSSAFWFRSQWLLPSQPSITKYANSTGRNRLVEPPYYTATTSTATAAIANGRPFSTNGMVEVHIVESWESPNHWNETRGNTTRTIHAYSNAPFVELFANGLSRGKQSLVPMIEGDGGTYGEWVGVPWKAGILTALARSENGTELARTTKETNTHSTSSSTSSSSTSSSAHTTRVHGHQIQGIPATATATATSTNNNDRLSSSSSSLSLSLSLDCPSPHTGTGNSLFLDGQDAALVRATVLDASGRNTLHFSSHNVTFRIVSGPGMIQGTANGDPKSYRSHTSTSHTAYHGLVRAVVRVTSAAGLSANEKQLLTSMEVDDNGGGGGGDGGSDGDDYRSCASTRTTLSYDDERDVVIEAASPGFAPVRLYIPTSTSREEASVLAVAAKGAGRPVDFFA